MSPHHLCSVPSSAGQLWSWYKTTRDGHSERGTRELLLPWCRHGNAGDADSTSVPRISGKSSVWSHRIQTTTLSYLVQAVQEASWRSVSSWTFYRLFELCL